jgi:hypothetical protein
MALAAPPFFILILVRDGGDLSEDQRDSPHGVAEGGWRKAVYALWPPGPVPDDSQFRASPTDWSLLRAGERLRYFDSSDNCGEMFPQKLARSDVPPADLAGGDLPGFDQMVGLPRG